MKPEDVRVRRKLDCHVRGIATWCDQYPPDARACCCGDRRNTVCRDRFSNQPANDGRAAGKWCRAISPGAGLVHSAQDVHAATKVTPGAKSRHTRCGCHVPRGLGRPGMPVAECDVPIHEIADRPHTPPTRRRLGRTAARRPDSADRFRSSGYREAVEQRIRGKVPPSGAPGHDHVRQTRIRPAHRRDSRTCLRGRHDARAPVAGRCRGTPRSATTDWQMR